LVKGTLAGHRFDALVFPGHADNPDWELGDSRISKLWVQRREDHETVFNWDRGSDLPPADELTGAIVDFLAAGLAQHVFGH
jgi:hypothetical protein